MSAFIVVTPGHRCDPDLAIAAARAGETGILNLGFQTDRSKQAEALRKLARFADRKAGSWGIRWDGITDSGDGLAGLSDLPHQPWPVLLLATADNGLNGLEDVLREARTLAKTVYLEVVNVDQALAAQKAGFDGLVIKGHESGGRVGSESAFLMLQRLHGRLSVPYWVQGAMGPETAAAAVLAGASGVVLNEQLWLAAESPFSQAEREEFQCFDGSETAVVGDGERMFRFLSRANRQTVYELESALASGQSWTDVIHQRSHSNGALHRKAGRNGSSELHRVEPLIPLGQEIAFAKKLADAHQNVAGILQAFCRRIQENLDLAREQGALAPEGPLAKAHRTRYPILQGPMTRVSDVSAFCESVQKNGALPFLALALMSGEDVRKLLTDTRSRLGNQPWGVGILGFVPPDLRNAQLEVIREIAPPYAIIAGGRPSQATKLESANISTYLHVPSPGLLKSFLQEGARKFVFEGRECGGHVGPRTSFSLWQSAIDVLLDADIKNPDECEIVFAGGIHDALSAAMVAACAAPLVARGMKIGVLMGTAYLFTREAVECGAIGEEFQRQAVACQGTVLLESGVGHATRCIQTPYADEFQSQKLSLLQSKKSSDEIRTALESLNIGRLRIASKGVIRADDRNGSTGVRKLVPVDGETQRRSGMFMIGQLAALRHEVVSMVDLHRDVSEGGAALLHQFSTAKLPLRRPSRGKRKKSDDIAIVGMAGMFPQASDLRLYWQNILNGVNAIQVVPPNRWKAEDYYSEDRFARDRVYSKWGGFLGDVVFDPMQWRIPPASIKSIDMIQLMALDVAWKALKDAGYDHRPFPRETTGVLFAVAGSHDVGTDYCFRTMLRHHLPKVEGISEEAKQQIYRELDEKLPEWTEDSFPGFLLNVIAGRIANRLDLRGPNYVVDAACAASLAALHAGIEQLRQRTSDMMLVGAADATNNPFCYMSFAKTHALSPRGRSRPFDDSADGIALGEGIATIVLKRLDDAERDGDKIYAVIKGIGSSSDGKNRSLTAPCPDGQVQALTRAYKDAQINPATVSLIEAHGTGTAVGDSTEIASLTQLFTSSSDQRQHVAVGSVKSMIGHTKTAAGLASLVKTALALKHRVLPPTIGVEKPNSRVDFEHSPFYINSETRPWIEELKDAPRRAGVSAFGFGGTNFHVVLEEYTGKYHENDDVDFTPRSSEVLFWRRPSPADIRDVLTGMESKLSQHEPAELAQLAYAVHVEESSRHGQKDRCRMAIVADSIPDLHAKVKRAIAAIGDAPQWSDPTGIYYGELKPVEPGEVCFLYPGQGSQSRNMLRDLVVASPWSLGRFAQSNRLLGDWFSKPLSRYVYPCPEFDETRREQHQSELNDTRVAQPALGLVEVFATDLLRRYGIRPGMAAGHSYGEYVALYAAGVLSWEDLLRISAHRGRIAAECGEKGSGAMAAVAADAETTQAAVSEFSAEIQLANLNGPKQTIIAGPSDVIDEAITRLSQRGLRSRRIPVTAAFHTEAMKPGAEALSVELKNLAMDCPRIPVYSNTVAGRYPDEPAEIRRLLARQFTEAVQFEQEIRQIHADGGRVFVEVGPGRVLTGLVDSILQDAPHAALSLDAPGRNGWTQFGHLSAALAAMGLAVNFEPWFSGRGLLPLTTEEFFEKVKSDRHPKPQAWILNPSSATPVTPIPKRKPAADSEATRALHSKFQTKLEQPKTAVPVNSVPDVDAKDQPPRSDTAAMAKPTQEPQPASGRAAPDGTPQKSPPSSGLAAGQAPGWRPSAHVTQPPAVPIRVPGSASPFNGSSPGSLNRVETGPAMTHDQATSQPPDNAPMAAHMGSELLSQMQFAMSQWLDLQRSQQRVAERFLDVQERILAGVPAGMRGQQVSYMLPSPAITPTSLAAPMGNVPMSVPAPAQVAGAAPLAHSPSAFPAPNAPAAPAPPVAMGPSIRPPVPVPVEPAVPTKTSVRVSPLPEPAKVPAPVAKQTPPPASVPESRPRPTADAATSTNGPPPTEAFRDDLLVAVSERTGYPVDMLDEDLPLESGLGIDSIKTVEIFSNLKTYHAYFRQDNQDEEELLTEFTKLKTLGDIVRSYDMHRKEFCSTPPPNGRAASLETAHSNGRGNGSVQSLEPPMERLTLEAVEVAGPSESEKKNSPRVISS